MKRRQLLKLAEAGLDRNMIIYDDRNHGFSTRLISLIKNINIHNPGINLEKCVTDVFLSNKLADYPLNKIQFSQLKVHFVENDLWKQIEKSYADMGGCLTKDKKNLVIAVSNISNSNFIMPHDSKNFNLFMFDNRKVLLGCY